MKHRWIVLSLLALVAAPLSAGVVYEIEVTDHGQSPPKTDSMEASVEGKNLKMEIAPGSSQAQGRSDMIYRGDRREVVVVDHDSKTYTVMDEATIRQLAGQANDAMRQMQEALKNVPEGQREMIEKMMKERMPAAAATPKRPKSELRKTSERGDKNGYPCVKYEALLDGRRVRELWVTDWSNVEGGGEVADAFHGMAGFFQEMLDSLPNFGQGPVDTFYEHMKELGGFPVVTREFDDGGALEGESTLRSSSRRTLDPADFEPPAGYKRRSMGPGG